MNQANKRIISMVNEKIKNGEIKVIELLSNKVDKTYFIQKDFKLKISKNDYITIGDFKFKAEKNIVSNTSLKIINSYNDDNFHINYR